MTPAAAGRPAHSGKEVTRVPQVLLHGALHLTWHHKESRVHMSCPTAHLSNTPARSSSCAALRFRSDCTAALNQLAPSVSADCLQAAGTRKRQQQQVERVPVLPAQSLLPSLPAAQPARLRHHCPLAMACVLLLLLFTKIRSCCCCFFFFGLLSVASFVLRNAD